VQQEPFLFNDTISKNVEYGLVGTAWEHATEKQKRKLVIKACKEAFADEFICRLPEVCKFRRIFLIFHGIETEVDAGI
jgi:ATP-binding cassette, subfamily B (MDR/TAP), member 1